MKADTLDVLIVGAGKLGDLLLDCLEGDERYRVSAFIDDGRAGERLAGVPILAPDDPKLPEVQAAFLAIGFPRPREAMFERCSSLRLPWRTFVDRRAFVSSRASIGVGTLVLSYAMVAATARLGNFVYLSSYARVGAGSVVGDFTSIMSGAAVGSANVGRRCLIGTNASCLDGGSVGDGAALAPYALVRGNVPPGGLAAAPPSRVVRGGSEAAGNEWQPGASIGPTS